MADLFTVAKVRLSRRKPRPARNGPPELKLDRSVLSPPEIQALPSFLPPSGLAQDRDPPATLRLVDRALAESKFPQLGRLGGAAPFREKRRLMGEALRRGDLPYRGRTIVEDRSGNVIDGVALLGAIIDTDIAVCCTWVTGVDRNALCVMDRHKPRRRDGMRHAMDAVAETPLAGRSHEATYADLVHRSTSAWVVLTKPMADACLASRKARGLPCRKVKPGEELYRDVKAGNFIRTGQPIVIDADGTMRDGARRCHVVSKTGKPIPVLVTYGIDPALPEDVFDCTSPENLGFHLQRLAIAEGWDAQGSLRVLCMMDGLGNPTQYDLYALYRSWPDYERAVRVSKGYQSHLCQSVHVAIRAVLSRRYSPEAADAFLGKVLTKSGKPAKVAEFRRDQEATMSPREARAARVVWDLIGTRLTKLPKARKAAFVELVIEAFRTFSGERARPRRIEAGPRPVEAMRARA